ncbi:hypothetical protein GCM10028775_48350 [Catellatospora paridis]
MGLPSGLSAVAARMCTQPAVMDLDANLRRIALPPRVSRRMKNPADRAGRAADIERFGHSPRLLGAGVVLTGEFAVTYDGLATVWRAPTREAHSEVAFIAGAAPAAAQRRGCLPR